MILSNFINFPGPFLFICKIEMISTFQGFYKEKFNHARKAFSSKDFGTQQLIATNLRRILFLFSVNSQNEWKSTLTLSFLCLACLIIKVCVIYFVEIL